MLDTKDVVRALPLVLVSVILFLFGYRARRRGAQEYVHRVVDWSRISTEGKTKAGTFVGAIYYLMGLLILGCAAWLAADPGVVAEWLGLALAVPIAAIVVVLIVGLRRYAKRYPAPTVDKHERR